MYFYDPTMLLIIPGLLLALWAQVKVNNAFSKYGKLYSKRGITGAQAARTLLDGAGLNDIRINRVSGKLTDNFDPVSRQLNLSNEVYDSSSISALGVAAHECGHAMQQREGYAMFSLRSAVVPVVNIGSSLSWPIFLLGLVFSFRPLMLAGIILFSFMVLFTLVTLPVELNASSRAVYSLESGGYLSSEELDGAKKVLNAAALTYVASALSAILQLLRLVLLSNRRNRD